MKKVAVFGNAGGGKSALAQRLAALTGLPLYVVDMMQFRPGGAKVPHDEFLQAHADILRRDEWIIDGFGNMAIAWERFAAADTLIYVDLPLFIHFRWITERLIKGLFADPPGWPENSPLWSSSVQSYRVLWLCHRHLTPKYRQLVTEGATSKRVHHLRSPGQICSFLKGVKKEPQRIPLGSRRPRLATPQSLFAIGAQQEDVIKSVLWTAVRRAADLIIALAALKSLLVTGKTS